MNYCSDCAATIVPQVPDGDNRLRHVCTACGMIHYQNPKNVCGAILYQGEQVLLCQRAIEPRYGRWTLPAGFMENGETVAEAAAREAMEEAHATSGELRLFGVFSMPYISQVYLMFHGALTSDAIAPGIESLEVGLFRKDDIPWDELAFPVVHLCLELYFAGGVGKVHHAVFSRDSEHQPSVHRIE